AEDPEYTLYITMKKPKNYDGLIIPGIANPLLKRAMDLHAVDMADETQSSKVQVSDYRNLTPTVASDDLENKGLVPIVIGDGDKVVAQSSADQASLLPGEKVILLTNGTTLQMPDVTGWSKAYLLKLAKLLSMTATFTGEGYAVEQSIDVGAEITGEKLHFVLNKEN
ncbi:MAG: PASTA domain-containing protein, partial [Enterococcus sp.]|nr:PASTA domain-containing protein [Enterococcus sp.]